jgi:hypothetical protein
MKRICVVVLHKGFSRVRFDFNGAWPECSSALRDACSRPRADRQCGADATICISIAGESSINGMRVAQRNVCKAWEAFVSLSRQTV